MRTTLLLALCCALAPSAAPLPTLVAAQAKPQAGGDAGQKKAYAVGSLVRRELALPTLDATDVDTLVFGQLEELETPPVVLMWWSLRDPLCRKSEAKLAKLAAEYQQKGVRFYLVESNLDELVAGIGDPLEKIRRQREDAKITLPLLIDRDNKVADEFGAICGSHVFVIDDKRTIRYSGSIDNNPEDKPGVQVEAYLREAIDLALERKSPKFDLRRPKGRPIKRVPVETDGVKKP